VRLDRRATGRIDVVNARGSAGVVLAAAEDLGSFRYTIRDCQGAPAGSGEVRLDRGTRELAVPPAGLLTLERVGAPR
jgi:hypothetical protein